MTPLFRRSGWLLLLIAGACGDKESDSVANPGSSGAAATGGATTGGSIAAGGLKATGGAAGGRVSSAGGVTGGAGNTGGVTAGGSNAGGITPTGGVAPTGGQSAGAGGTAAGAPSNAGTGAAGAPSGGTSGGGSGASGGSAGGGAGTPHTGVWNVMPLGDSITASTCYPQVLSKLFKAGGHTNFQFVGGQTSNQSCGSDAPSVKAEGHGGYGVTYLPMNSKRSACTKSTGCGSYAELQTWTMVKPDIVLMHYGTNDVWDGQPTADIMAAYLAVIAEFRKQNPNVIFFVSKIIKLSPSGCANCSSDVQALAAALTADWAATNSTASSPVHIVDDYDSGFDPSNTADAADAVHPTLAGATKMATATYNDVIAKAYF